MRLGELAEKVSGKLIGDDAEFGVGSPPLEAPERGRGHKALD